MVNAILAANAADSIPRFLETHYTTTTPRVGGDDTRDGKPESRDALRLVCLSSPCLTCSPAALPPPAKRGKLREVPAVTAGARVGLSLKRATPSSAHACFMALPYR